MRLVLSSLCVLVFAVACAANDRGREDAAALPWPDAGVVSADGGAQLDAAPIAPRTQSERAAAAVSAHAVTTDSVLVPAGEVTYQRHIRPLLETNCVECHSEGGIGPSRLDDWNTVKVLGPAIVAAVGSGRMPPWPASASCHPIAESRGLSSATKQRFAAWGEGGYAEGSAADYVAPESPRRLDIGPPTRTMIAAEAFTPVTNSDSYRCFYLGSLEADTFVTALDIVPGVRSEVHHAQLHRVAPEQTGTVKSMDDMAAGGGYPCSSAGVGGSVPSQNMFSYRPGSVTVLLPAGDAVYLAAGSGLVLQIHYNTQFLRDDEPPLPDRTRLDLWSLPAGSAPARVIYRAGILSPLGASGDGSLLPVLSSSIPSQGRVISESTLPMSKVSVLGSGTIGLGAVRSAFIPGEIVGMTPHAHGWATRMVASLQRPQSLECLVDVPRWDYEWQLDYMFGDGISYGPDDQLHVQCDYDNTDDNQPVINGKRRPTDVIMYGENTLNEMCLHYLWLRFDYGAFRAATP